MAERGYALAALDMDGTLLDSDHNITPFTRDALARAGAAGKVIALCTGRCLSELWGHLEANPGIRYAICESGGCVWDVGRGRAIRQLVIEDRSTRRVLDLAQGYDVCVQLFVGGQSYMRISEARELKRYHIYDFRSVFEAGSVFVEDARAVLREKGGAEKINLYFTCPEDKARFGEAIRDLGLTAAPSLSDGFELSPPGATKAKGLEALCRHLGLSLSEAMAVGDGGNDLDLMRAAGFSVAMGNACEAVLAEADAVTDDCDHDGAAKAILRYLLGKA